MIKRVLTVVSLLLVCVLLFAGCSSQYAFDALGNPSDGKNVSSNGGTVVVDGEYTYFINGEVASTVENVFGEVVKGSVARVKTATIGTKDEKIEILAPKAVYYANANGAENGLFIYNSRLFYTSTSNNKDKEGSRLTTHLDFFSCKLDGSDTQLHYTLKSNTVPYMIVNLDGKATLIFVKDTTVVTVDLSNNKGTEVKLTHNDLTMEKVTGQYFDAKAGVLYFNYSIVDGKDYANEDKVATYNTIVKYDGKKTETIWDGKETMSKATVVNADNGFLYFTTTSTNATEEVGTWVKKGTEKPVLLSTTAITTFLPNSSGTTYSIIYTPTLNTFAYTAKLTYVNDTTPAIVEKLSTDSGTLVKVDTVNNLVYFAKGNILYRTSTIVPKNPKSAEAVTKSTMTSTMGKYEFIGNRIYFINASETLVGYMYFVEYDKDNNVIKEEDKIVETRLGQLTEDDIKSEEEDK